MQNLKSPRARRTDPATSHEAGEKVSKLRASQARVLSMFKLYGDMHDKQLMDYLHDAEKAAGLKPMSPSGVRSRRSELARPNMERLSEIMREDTGLALGQHDLFAIDKDSPAERLLVRARDRLRIEGFRSPLWDTGKREIVDGRTVIIWGLAR